MTPSQQLDQRAHAGWGLGQGQRAVLVQPQRRAIDQRDRRAARAIASQGVARADAFARRQERPNSLRQASQLDAPFDGRDVGGPLLAAARRVGVAQRPQRWRAPQSPERGEPTPRDRRRQRVEKSVAARLFVVAYEPSTPLLFAQRSAQAGSKTAPGADEPRFVSRANNQTSRCDVSSAPRPPPCPRLPRARPVVRCGVPQASA